MNIIVIGAGAIGKERIKALEKLGENIIAVIDPNISQVNDYPCYMDINDCNLIPDWYFVCTPHDTTVKIVKKLEFEVSLHKTKILVEKPYLGKIRVDNVGFNYRFFKGVKQLLIDVKEKIFGELISVNMILALGDGPGTDKTWRLDPLRAGKGAMLDPGIHLIDLAMLISEGTLEYVSGIHDSKFWNTGFEEEVHALAHDKNNCIYNIQASKVRWRNTFRIEVNGTDGYGIVEGRNRNYGYQTYLRGKRWGWLSGKNQRETEEIVIKKGIEISFGRVVGGYDEDDSFYEETKAVLYGTGAGTWEDNKRCLEFIQ